MRATRGPDSLACGPNGLDRVGSYSNESTFGRLGQQASARIASARPNAHP